MVFISGQFYRFGKNPELRGVSYIAYPLEALFFDALQGVPLSCHLILRYYADCVKRQAPVPRQIEEYIAGILFAITDGDVEPDYLLNPKGLHSKGKDLSPAVVSMVELSRNGGDRRIPLRDNGKGPGAYSLAGERLSSMLQKVNPRHMEDYISMGVRPDDDYPPINDKKIERLYQRQKKREARIEHVQSILDRYYDETYQTGSPEAQARHKASRAELKEIYSYISTLD